MTDATLSRWTMSYFVAALVCLLLAEGLMTCGFGLPAAPLLAPDTLALVHLISIGWLSLAMCGALVQFVPVLTNVPLRSERTPPIALALLLAGLGLLLSGFLQLGGRVNSGLPLLSAAVVALGGGFSLIIWNLGATLWTARPLTPPARFVAVGLTSAIATVVLGMMFALILDGSISTSAASPFMFGALPLHVVAGLGGWLTITAAGVSYRLLSMFMLAPDTDPSRAAKTLRMAGAAIFAAVAGGLACLLASTSPLPALLLALVLGLAALALYARDITALYRFRRRRALELNSRMAAIALGNLAAVTVLSVGLLLSGRFLDHIAAVIFLASFGWLTGLVLAKMYKIVAFLTWLECYGPVLGRQPTPRVQDLVAEATATRWFMAFFAAVWLATIALLFDNAWIFRTGAFAMTLATFAITVELVRTRRLARVPAQTDVPAPCLLYSTPRTP